MVLWFITGVGHCRNILHDDFGRFRLPRSRFAADNDARVSALLLHDLVGGVGDGENVWGVLEQLPICGYKKE